MAIINDLTFAQLNTALGGSGKIAVSSGKVVIDVGGVTGDTIDDLADQGVVELLSKLLEAASRAQTTVNENQAVGERLNAFPAPTFGGTQNGTVSVTQTMTARIAVSPATQSSITGAVV
jgi:hypothetical protein